ncbi:uncharacterized protein A4U43_C03F13140 [Asparagus officinalis]|uniref:Uncharacterized protein n=1 Tax=Asparagus officinalis TaxID=4686 RepID=A0A5P1FBF9_ASPOF|nr:uncharacterized protein A4U43_C03F13140 [Asparagus officinalis]
MKSFITVVAICLEVMTHEQSTCPCGSSTNPARGLGSKEGGGISGSSMNWGELGECRLNTEDPEILDNKPPAEECKVQILIQDNKEEELVEDLGEYIPKLKPLLITREELGECRLNTEDREVPDNEPPAEEGKVQILI